MRIIAHLDMDAFFAAVEEREHEWLKGKPIVVGADPKNGQGRGVVSTANYLAREYGIKSATPITKAWQLAKEAERKGQEPTVFVRPYFPRYEETSGRIFDILKSDTALVEGAGIDEAYFDLSGRKSFAEAEKFCRAVKLEIYRQEKLTCSIGLASNKLLAKIASDRQKPNGLTVVLPGEEEGFLNPLSIRVIPGIGPKTEAVFKVEGYFSVHDLKKLSREELSKKFGKWGLGIYDKARGLDDSPVLESYEVKSIGEQETFLKDTREISFLLARLDELCDSVHERLRRGGFLTFRSVEVTVRFSDFSTFSRSKTLKEDVGGVERLKFEALRLFLPFTVKKGNPEHKSFRLIGVRVSKLKS